MKQRIMIVDDDATTFNLMEATLSEAGYSVMAFKSAVDAFAHINTHPKSIDLLVTDYSMPLMNGFELAQKLKNIQQDIPVMLITGYEIGYLEASLQPQIIDQALRKLPKSFTKGARAVAANGNKENARTSVRFTIVEFDRLVDEIGRARAGKSLDASEYYPEQKKPGGLTHMCGPSY